MRIERVRQSKISDKENDCIVKKKTFSRRFVTFRLKKINDIDFQNSLPHNTYGEIVLSVDYINSFVCKMYEHNYYFIDTSLHVAKYI